jgi:hypothetical protein
VNEQSKIVNETWDVVNLMFTFIRTVDERVMTQWYEVMQIASSISFMEE